MACALPPLSIGGRGVASSSERPPRPHTKTIHAGAVVDECRGRCSGGYLARSGSRSRASSCSAKPAAEVQADATPGRRAASLRPRGASLDRPRHTAPASIPGPSSADVSHRRAASPRERTTALRPVHAEQKPAATAQANRPNRSARSSSSLQSEAAGSSGVRASRDAAYRYVVQFGNNSGLIRQILRGRPNWCPAPGDPGNSAGKGSYQEKSVKLSQPCMETEINFLWSQYKCSAFFDAMAHGRRGVAVVLNEEKTIKFKASKQASSVPAPLRIHNHFEGSGLLCTKRGICDSMSAFYAKLGRDPFGVVPLTFIVREGTADPQFALWRQAFDAFASHANQPIWIVKPGEWGNRGCGIKIYNAAADVAQRVDSKAKVWAIQKYIERPLLIHKRKFDIRAYCLVVQEPQGGSLRAFCYRDAYLRTTSAQYTTKKFNKLAHLNNDAVQKHGENYGKFESANKMSLDEFQKYLDEHNSRDGINVRQHIMPRIGCLMADTVRAVAPKLNPRSISNCFEVYGFDFMMDASYRIWLIECNANPCLDLCCSYLSRIIPAMLDEALQLTVDRILGAAFVKSEINHGGEGGTKWDLVYDSSAEAWPPEKISCTWVEALPEDADHGRNVAVLGWQIANSKRSKAKKSIACSATQGSPDAAKVPADGIIEEESESEDAKDAQQGYHDSAATTDCVEDEDDDEDEDEEEYKDDEAETGQDDDDDELS